MTSILNSNTDTNIYIYILNKYKYGYFGCSDIRIHPYPALVLSNDGWTDGWDGVTVVAGRHHVLYITREWQYGQLVSEPEAAGSGSDSSLADWWVVARGSARDP